MSFRSRLPFSRTSPRGTATAEKESVALASMMALCRRRGAWVQEQGDGLGAPFSYAVAGLESLAKADAGFTLGVAIHGTATDGGW